MTRIWAQARKELTQLVRDRRAMVLVLLLPVIQLVMMSLSISITVNDLPIVIQDFDDSSASRAYADAFRASLTFHVVSWPVNQEPEEAFKAGLARGALIIPAHFARDLARLRPACSRIDGSCSCAGGGAALVHPWPFRA